jgi:hypothetical protein
MSFGRRKVVKSAIKNRIKLNAGLFFNHTQGRSQITAILSELFVVVINIYYILGSTEKFSISLPKKVLFKRGIC